MIFQFYVEELHWLAQRPELNIICKSAQHQDWTSLMLHVAKWEQIPAVKYKTLVESLEQHINAHRFGLKCSTTFSVGVVLTYS